MSASAGKGESRKGAIPAASAAAAAATAGAPADAPAAPPAVPRWAVWRRFRRRRSALAALAVLGVLFVTAALAPFLAGNRPIVLSDEKGLRFPVFAAFTREDFFWLAALVSAVFLPLVAAILRRRCSSMDGAARRRVVLAVAAAALITVLALGMAWPERLARDDYRNLRDGGEEAAFCVFPLVPYGPYEMDLDRGLRSPGSGNWLGTSFEGEDLLARMIHGARVSLLVAVTAVAVCLAIGILLGAAAGYFGGLVDALVSRLIEVVTCFPAFFAVLAVLAFLPPRIIWVMLLIGLVRWPGVARLTRGEFLKLRESEFITAARAMGLSNGRIIFRHVLPNSLAPVIVAATFGMAGAILIESGLSFLGIGPANYHSWGRLLSEFKPYFEAAWWLSVFPGAGIFITVLSLNLIGEGLRDALDPRLKES